MNLFISAMRTLVPVGVAALLTVTGRLGIPVDDDTAAGMVSLALAGAYWAAFRGLEALAERMAWRPLQLVAGVLLGWARPPAYEAPLTVPIRVMVDKRNLEEETRAAIDALQRAQHARRPTGGF